MLGKMDLWFMFFENHASFEVERECLRTMCILEPKAFYSALYIYIHKLPYIHMYVSGFPL